MHFTYSAPIWLANAVGSGEDVDGADEAATTDAVVAVIVPDLNEGHPWSSLGNAWFIRQFGFSKEVLHLLLASRCSSYEWMHLSSLYQENG